MSHLTNISKLVERGCNQLVTGVPVAVGVHGGSGHRQRSHHRRFRDLAALTNPLFDRTDYGSQFVFFFLWSSWTKALIMQPTDRLITFWFLLWNRILGDVAGSQVGKVFVAGRYRFVTAWSRPSLLSLHSLQELVLRNDGQYAVDLLRTHWVI